MTGSVTFQDGGVNIPGCVEVSVSSGQAACTTSSLASGMRVITAVYSGDIANPGATGRLAPDQHVIYCLHAITVTNNADSGAGSLRQAIADACSGGTLTFDNNYTITLGSTLTIGGDMTINGSGHTVAVSGNNAVPVFQVNSGVNFNLRNMTVQNGATGDDGTGGGLYNDGGTVNVTGSTFSGNNAGIGGGIYNNSGTLSVKNSAFSGNAAHVYQAFSSGEGAAIYNRAALYLTNSTFSGNSADKFGDGLYTTPGSTVTMKNTILTNGTSGYLCYLDGAHTDGGGNLAGPDGFNDCQLNAARPSRFCPVPRPSMRGSARSARRRLVRQITARAAWISAASPAQRPVTAAPSSRKASRWAV